ncbi:MAG: O-methyltransferase [Planctomycetota bacterium]|nr:O-methyltransferase [Planctomycetota bacterium]
MDMTQARWTFLNDYSNDLFGAQDEHLAGLMDEAIEAGLPDIAVSADVGRLLKILTMMTPAPGSTQGRLALELGTLGGYSGIWIARGLGEGGKLITVEYEDLHADFAQQQFEKAGVANQVEIVRGAALDVLPGLRERLGDASLAIAFLDAVKLEYPMYWEHVKPMIAPGGLVIADNIYGAGWNVEDEANEQRIAMDEFCRLVANDSEFETTGVPLRSGLLIGRRKA